MLEIKPTLYVMIGIPGSGKSTFSRNVLCKMHNATHVSRDEIRGRFAKDYSEEFVKDNESLVYKEYIDSIGVGLLVGDVIADATQYTAKSRKNLLKNLSLNNVDVVYIVMNTPLKVCKERNSSRKGREYVTEDKIDFFFNHLELPYELSDFEKGYVKQIWWIEYK